MIKTTNLRKLKEYKSFVKHVEEKLEDTWSEWLSFDDSFKESGAQGYVGLFKPIKCEYKNIKVLFKVSKTIDYLIRHEYSILKSLNDMIDYCPHFCRLIGKINCEINNLKDDNPFNVKELKHPLETEVLLMEYIENSIKMGYYIQENYGKEKSRSENKKVGNVIMSNIKQTLLSISIAQKIKHFTHYDLHSDNIMMKMCNPDRVFLYIIDDGTQFCVPTNGYYPVIIDFGFSYSKDMENKPCYPSISNSHIGFTSNKCDLISDCKLLLTGVSSELLSLNDNSLSKRFKKIVKNIFAPLRIDKINGWDKQIYRSPTDIISDMLKGYNQNSDLFFSRPSFVIDLIQTLIILPLEKQSYVDINISFCGFFNEFSKIENEIGNSYYNLYILQGIIDIAREVRQDYIKKGKNRIKAVEYFKKSVYERIDFVAKFCRPKLVKFETMLCSLLCLSKNFEGLMYDTLKIQSENKKKEYEKLPLSTIDEIYAVLEVNIPSVYTFNPKTEIIVLDCKNKTTSELILTKNEINNVNDIEWLYKGTYLYSIFNKK
jgi:hypothetical protein